MADEKKPKMWKDPLTDKNAAEVLLGGPRWLIKKHITGYDLFNLHEIVTAAGSWGISRMLFLLTIFIALAATLTLEAAATPSASLMWMLLWLVGTAPVWLPIALLVGAYHAWIWYKRSAYISGRDPVLLEVKMPRDITKSPRAMEIAFMSCWLGAGEMNMLQRFWRGQVRPWFSFEIASFGGDVHFYIWTWRANKSLIESAMYGQYPEVEIYEAEDYASKFTFDPAVHGTHCVDFKYEKADPYPIRTYIDYELDKDPKEELKIDPFGQVLEALGSIKPHEQMWIQINIRQAGKYGGVYLPKNRETEWRAAVKKGIEAVHVDAMKNPKDEKTAYMMPHLTWRQKELTEAMERHLTKLPFETFIRGAYIADTTRGTFDVSRVTLLRFIWRPFGSPTMNGFMGANWSGTLDYPWQDFMKFRSNLITRRFLDAYWRRSSFYIPWDNMDPIVMTTEALASIWHPPSRTVIAPGLQRISSTKSEPPPNLPI